MARLTWAPIVPARMDNPAHEGVVVPIDGPHQRGIDCETAHWYENVDGAC